MLSGCADKDADCSRYGLGVCTNEYKDWAQENCADFCGYCDGTFPRTPKPTLSTSKPVVTVKPPTPSTDKPVITVKPPTPSTDKPVITMKPPTPGTDKPVVTLKPTGTTKAPVVTPKPGRLINNDNSCRYSRNVTYINNLSLILYVVIIQYLILS